MVSTTKVYFQHNIDEPIHFENRLYFVRICKWPKIKSTVFSSWKQERDPFKQIKQNSHIWMDIIRIFTSETDIAKPLPNHPSRQFFKNYLPCDGSFQFSAGRFFPRLHTSLHTSLLFLRLLQLSLSAERYEKPLNDTPFVSGAISNLTVV